MLEILCKLRRHVSVAFVFIFFSLLLRSSGLFVDYLFSDEGTYSIIANALLSGKRLYVDVVDNKPPLLYGLYTLIFKVAGPYNIVAVRFVFDIVIALTAFILYLTLCRNKMKSEGILAGLFYIFAVSSFQPYEMQAANAEVLFNLPVSLAILFGTETLRGTLLLFSPLLAGLFCGIAFMTKYQAGMTWLSLLIFFMGWAPKEKRNGAIRNGILVTLGFGFGTGVVLLYLARQGAVVWEGFLQWPGKSLLEYIEPAGISSLQKIKNCVSKIGPLFICLSYLVFGSVRYCRHLRAYSDKKFSYLFAIAGLGGLLAMSIGGRFFPHYAIQPLLFISLLSGMTLVRFAGNRLLNLMVLAPAVVFAAVPYFPSAFPTPPEDYLYRPEIDYIKNTTDRNAPIFVWGRPNLIYFYTRRPFAGRFTSSVWITNEYAGFNYRQEGRGAVLSSKMLDLLLSDFSHSPPELIIDVTPDLKQFRHWPVEKTTLGEYVRHCYFLEKEFPGTRIYRRNLTCY